jgi:hypothetical protein
MALSDAERNDLIRRREEALRFRDRLERKLQALRHQPGVNAAYRAQVQGVDERIAKIDESLAEQSA